MRKGSGFLFLSAAAVGAAGVQNGVGMKNGSKRIMQAVRVAVAMMLASSSASALTMLSDGPAATSWKIATEGEAK